MDPEKTCVNSRNHLATELIWVIDCHMIQLPDLEALEQRARKARVTMAAVCAKAAMFRQSWYRARKRGRMEYVPYDRLCDAMAEIERERA